MTEQSSSPSGKMWPNFAGAGAAARSAGVFGRGKFGLEISIAKFSHSEE